MTPNNDFGLCIFHHLKSFYLYLLRSLPTHSIFDTQTVEVFFQINQFNNFPDTTEQLTIQFNSILTLTTWSQKRPPQVKDSIPQDCPPITTSDVSCKSWTSYTSDKMSINQEFPQLPPQVPQFARTAYKIQKNSLFTITGLLQRI